MKGYSIHVGVGEVNFNHYKSTKRVDGPEKDVADLWNLVEKLDIYDKSFILTTQKSVSNGISPTVENFNACLDEIIKQTKINASHENGSIESYVLITFSGHGSTYKYKNKMERDVEFLCFYDRMLMEHEFKVKLLEFPKEVKCFIIIDACYSAGQGDESSNQAILLRNGIDDIAEHKIVSLPFLDDLITIKSTLIANNLLDNSILTNSDFLEPNNIKINTERLIDNLSSVKSALFKNDLINSNFTNNDGLLEYEHKNINTNLFLKDLLIVESTIIEQDIKDLTTGAKPTNNALTTESNINDNNIVGAPIKAITKKDVSNVMKENLTQYLDIVETTPIVYTEKQYRSSICLLFACEKDKTTVGSDNGSDGNSFFTRSILNEWNHDYTNNYVILHNQISGNASPVIRGVYDKYFMEHVPFNFNKKF